MRTFLVGLGGALLLALPCAADPAPAQPQLRTIKAGETIYRKYESSKGPVEILAEAQPHGTTLHLKDIAVYPRGTEKLDLGMRELYRLTGQLKADARALGFTKLHITGTRLTGAKPGKTPDLWFDTAPAPAHR